LLHNKEKKPDEDSTAGSSATNQAFFDRVLGVEDVSSSPASAKKRRHTSSLIPKEPQEHRTHSMRTRSTPAGRMAELFSS